MLEIVEDTQEVPFHFRFETEMSGKHGSIKGKSTLPKTKPGDVTFPAVALRNFNASKAIIRCTLYQVPDEEQGFIARPHGHRLLVRSEGQQSFDPLVVEVSSLNEFKAT